MSDAHRIPPRALAWVAVLTLLWGTNWMLFPLAVREVSVWTFRAVSMIGSGLVLLAVARARGLSLVVPRALRGRIALAALLNLTLWNIASTYASLMIPSGQAALLGFTMPLWSALITWAVLHEPITRRMLVALALGAAGVGLLMWRSLPAYAQAPLGVSLGLLSAVGWAVGTLVLKRSGATVVPPLVLTGWQMLIGVLPILVGAFAFAGSGPFWPSWGSVAVLVYITLVPVTLGNLAWVSVVTLVPANVAGLSSVLVPVVAMIAGALMHGEPLGPAQVAAMLCCGGAMGLVLLRR